MSKAVVLIVEDEFLVAERLKLALTGMGYCVLGVADSGRDAVRAAQLHQPDLVLMDARLSGQADGVEAARRIGQQFGIPIVYLAAAPKEGAPSDGEMSPPARSVAKPFAPGDLQEAIERALHDRPSPGRMPGASPPGA